MSKPFQYSPNIFLSFVLIVCTACAGSKTYIVHVTKPDHHHIHIEDLKTYHESFLPGSKTASGDDQHRVVLYSYKNVISGFAAKLTPDELEYVKTKAGFIAANEESFLRPHTTHSPEFLGLHYGQQDGFWKSSNYGEGTIIGVLDTGILPNHPSFDDKGMPPPPKKWKGRCDPEFNTSSPYHCNNKLIGARYFTNC